MIKKNTIIKKQSQENSFSTNTMLQKIKKVSWNIVHNIQCVITPKSPDERKDSEKVLSEIRGKDNILNVFLKVSSLICKISLIENKDPMHKEYNEILDLDAEVDSNKEIDIHLIEDFVVKNKKNNKKTKGKKI